MGNIGNSLELAFWMLVISRSYISDRHLLRALLIQGGTIVFFN